MIYADAEQIRWWNSLSKSERAEILGKMIEKSTDPRFALSLSKQVSDGKSLSAKQIAAIRKWAR